MTRTTLQNLPRTPRRNPTLGKRLRRGQSMVEYSIVTHALLLLGTGAAMGISQYLRLFDSLDIYLRSVYTVLAMGAV